MPKLNVDDNGLGLGGYDPVSYFGNGPEMGSSDFTASHEGIKYQFASEANQQSFNAAPSKFAVQYGGWCGVAASEGKYFETNPKTFSIDDGKLVLFYNGVEGNTLPQWQENPAERATNADKHWAADDLV